MNSRHRLILVITLFFVAYTLSGQNPFTAEPGISGDPTMREAPSFVVEWSRRLQERIATLTTNMQTGETASPGVLAFLLAVVFGMVHVAGPGHGKIFTIAYFGSRRARLGEGLALAALINLVDSVSAGMLVFVGYELLSVVFTAFSENVSFYLRIVSYGCILLFAVSHLIMHLRTHHHHHHGTTQDTRLKPWLLALSVGMVPCPVSTMLLVFGIVNQVVPFALLLVVGVSLGGFLTLGILSVSIIAGKTGFQKLLGGEKGEKRLRIFETAFSALLVGAALLLFVASLT